LFATMIASCAAEHVPPKALLDARAEVTRAKDGIAGELDPSDVHEAELALQRAERAWREAPLEPTTIDLALIAQRHAMFAESEAFVIDEQRQADRAHDKLQTVRTEQPGRAQMRLEQQQAAAAVEEQRLRELESKLRDARETIAKIASVNYDDRGMVITLQGEVLFPTGKATLKPAAMAKLDIVAKALDGKDQPIAVLGFTGSIGAREFNMELSQRRASAVRDYLVSKGVPKDLITAEGRGPEEPAADNGSVEGRAANRRVEIVVQPKK
jgi:outer membrane protein OmpA-like peptidoglycan-associated protein